MVNEIAPGARIVCRDAEWLVKSVAIAKGEGCIIEAVGVSEFIQGKAARFIAALDKVEVLRPEATQLVRDTSSGYQHSLLFLEAQIRQTAPDDGRLYQGHRAAMDILPYQLWPAAKALGMPRQRILIADAVGLGKTLECGILVTELIRRGQGRRILVVTTKSMMTQFQKEFWSRFTIPLVRLDSSKIQQVRSRIPGNHNPFHYYDRSIISIDTLKQDREYRTYLEAAHWDIIIIDEAHNVAKRGKGQMASKRARLADRLATRSDTLILLSATPHDGRAESFASLMNMLDPTAIANESDYTQEDIRDLYVRRFKKDVLADLQKHVPERQVAVIEGEASQAEERVFRQLDALQLTSDQQSKGVQLFKTTLLKAMLSSPMACLETVKQRLQRLKNKESRQTERAELTALVPALEAINHRSFAKYQALLKLIQEDWQWTGADPDDRLVIFTGRLATLGFLRDRLPLDLKLKKEAIALLDGGLPDTEQQEIVEAFGQGQSPVRILIATEVAAEGLNLHYRSHRLIHFDIPWSLMTLQQRNGRIDRYGQTHAPQIRYLLTRSHLERMDEVERIIKVLLNKDEQAIKNIGDPSVFMGVFDAEAEERLTEAAIANGITAQAFEQQLDDNAQSVAAGELDLFALFSSAPSDPSPEPVAPPVDFGSLPSVFASTFDYAAAAFTALEDRPPNLTINPEARFVELQLPPTLKQRYRRLPPEIHPDEQTLLHLTARPDAVMAAMEAARREQHQWPRQEYLWELHPVVEWLTDRCIFRFGRHQAPVIEVAQGLESEEVVFILFGSFPNRRGAPVLSRWKSVCFQQGKRVGVEPLEVTIARTQLGQQSIPNRGNCPLDDLLELRDRAVAAAQAAFLADHQAFSAQLAVQLQEQRDRLAQLQRHHHQQLELRLEDHTQNPIQAQRRQGALSRIETVFQDHRDWVELSMTTDPKPFIKLVAVLRGGAV
ncbi:MAG: DEAD/DEAH box helicase [Spirulina sp. DLM2.Bin59]|nr:MAG: DEAD/DEAH box helicase [Spirulina sp. DLM2.Bin59]